MFLTEKKYLQFQTFKSLKKKKKSVLKSATFIVVICKGSLSLARGYSLEIHSQNKKFLHWQINPWNEFVN